MRNTNTNTATMNMTDMMNMFMQAMQAQGMQALAQQAQAQQAQAIGAGDAGKALPLQGIAQQAQAQKAGRHSRRSRQAQQAQQAQAIPFERIERQNERQTVYDVRQAMVNGKSFASLVKAWIVLNEHDIPSDERVLRIEQDIRCACLQAKEMTVKSRDDKHAHFEVASMVTVKRAFYSAMRGMPIVETRKDTRPATRGKKAQGK